MKHPTTRQPSSESEAAANRLRDVLPLFYNELRETLERHGPRELLPQLADLRVESRCSCGDLDCASFNVTGGWSPLSDDEQHDRGRYDQGGVDLDVDRGLVVLDLDHLDRVISIEVLNRPDVRDALDRLTWLNRP